MSENKSLRRFIRRFGDTLYYVGKGLNYYSKCYETLRLGRYKIEDFPKYSLDYARYLELSERGYWITSLSGRPIDLTLFNNNTLHLLINML